MVDYIPSMKTFISDNHKSEFVEAKKMRNAEVKKIARSKTIRV